jgi:hypothetical protein
LEILALLVLFASLRVAFASIGKAPEALRLSGGKQLLQFTVCASIFLVMSWRDFFPDHRFRFSGGGDAIGLSLLMAFCLVLVPNISPFRTGKPSKEEERSVV